MGDTKITDLEGDEELEPTENVEKEELDEEELDDVAGGLSMLRTSTTSTTLSTGSTAPLSPTLEPDAGSLLEGGVTQEPLDPSLKIGRGGSVFGPRG